LKFHAALKLGVKEDYQNNKAQIARSPGARPSDSACMANFATLCLHADGYLAHLAGSRPLSLTEICGRYGPWVARGARLMNALAPEAEVAVVAVEQDVTSWHWYCIALRHILGLF